MSETYEADPTVLLEHACRRGLKGIVGKYRDQPYRSGRTGDWVEVECLESEAFFIVGCEPSSASPTGFGSLLMGAYRDGASADVGSVGTGFKEAEAAKLGKLRWKQKQLPVLYSGKANVVWVYPTLIADIEFRA